MVELLAVLAASAAVGLRIALPLLMIGLLYGEGLWARMPILCLLSPAIALALLVSWSLLEMILSKDRVGQRLLQSVELCLSPFVGTLMGMAVAQMVGVVDGLMWLLGGIGGLLALVLQLVQLGWFYRLRRVPVWAVFFLDALCIVLVLSAFDAPRQGGLIALLLLWLAIRSSKDWYRWYRHQDSPKSPNPRLGKLDPD